MALQTKKLSGSLGAEVIGIQLAHLSDQEFASIRSAFLEHHVLAFRGQDLSPEQQIAFGERFGSLQVHPIVPHMEGYPPILEIKNLGKERTITEIWHSDVTFADEPPMASALYALEVPSAGGDTLFANQHAAYERLSPGMKAMLDGLEAVHSGGGLASATRGGEGGPAWELQGRRHPVVRTHPESHKKALFVNPAFVVGLADMTRKESESILAFLYAHCTRPDLTMRHCWEKGDLVIWDNRSVQHFAVHDYGTQKRTMLRVTVNGDEPY